MTPTAPLALTLAILLTAGFQVPVTRLFAHGQNESRGLLFALLPAIGHLLACGGMISREIRRTDMDGPRGLSVLLFLGVAGFSLLVTLGLIVGLHDDVATALGRLAPALALAGLPALVGGAMVHRSLVGVQCAGTDRAAGTTVALAGMVVMLLAAALAWPRPGPLLVVSLIDFAALTIVAFRFGLPVAHALGIPCLTAAVVAIGALLAGVPGTSETSPADQMLAFVLAPHTGIVLLGLFALCALAAELIARAGIVDHGKYYAVGSIVVALLGLALVMQDGPSQPGLAAFACGFVGVGVLMMNRRWHQEILSYLGYSLLVGASLWGMWKVDGKATPTSGALLALEALVMVGPLALQSLRKQWLHGNINVDAIRRRPIVVLGSLVGWLAMLTAVYAAWAAGWDDLASLWAGTHILTAVALSALWTLRALAERSRVLARLGAWLALASIVVLAGFAGTLWPDGDSLLCIAAAAGIASAMMAAFACWLRARAPRGGSWRVDAGFAAAWAECAAGAVVLGFLLVLAQPRAWTHSFTLSGLTLGLFLLAWFYRRSVFSFVGSGGLFVLVCHALVRLERY